jgi:hypothetical protein
VESKIINVKTLVTVPYPKPDMSNHTLLFSNIDFDIIACLKHTSLYCLLPSVHLTRTLPEYLISSVRATYIAHLMLLNFIALIFEEYDLPGCIAV